MVENPRRRPYVIGFARNAVLSLCLLAPSAWMIATIPPLWRDVDAYIQVTHDPLISTFWGHSLAYGYVAKVPLFLGEQWERWRGHALPPRVVDSSQPGLSDAGIWLLIVAQHLALAGSAIYFIRAIAPHFWIRLALAVAWASNPLFYTLAHCVGSETLSLILIVLFAAKGLKLIQRPSQVRWTDWYFFAIGLWLCLLSRQVNALLILVLPAAFLFSSIQNRISHYFAAGDELRRRLATQDFRQALIAIAVGISCVATASSLPQTLARKTKFQPYSRVGYTFLYRLQFLKTLPSPTRTALLKKILARASSHEARQLITLLAQMHEVGADPTPRTFTERATPVLFPSERPVPWKKLGVALNQMASAFLLPPPLELWQAARTDFAAALGTSASEVIDNLFETTGYFFEHADEMPACAPLVTFRNSSVDAISRIPSEHSYFYLGRGITPNKLLLLWFFTLLILLVVARWGRVNVTQIAAFGVALVAVGLLITATNSLLTEFLPRFVVPIWQLLFLSFFLLAGATANLLAQGSPPGSHCRPEP